MYKILHLFVDIFASGRSTMKIILFGVAVAAFVFIFYRLKKDTQVRHTDEKKELQKRDTFLFLALGLLLFGLGVTFYHYKSLGVSMDNLLLVTAEHTVSMTHLFHSHVLKFSIGIFGGLLPEPLRLYLENGIDFGYAYNGVFPPIIGYIGAIAGLIAIILAIRFLASFMRQHKGRLGIQILFLIGLFSLLKNIFDGGILNHEAIPAFLLVWILSHKNDLSKPKQWIVPLIAQMIPIVVFVLAAWQGAITRFGVVEYPQTLFGLELLYLGLYCMCEKKLSKSFVLVLLALGVYGFAPVEQRAIGSFQYDAVPIANKLVYIGTYDGENTIGTFVEKIGDLSFYTLSTSTNMTVGKLTRAIGEPLLYSPVSVTDKTCPRKWPNTIQTFGVITKYALSKPSFEHVFANITKVRFVGNINGWNNYEVTTSMITCIPRILDVTTELLSEAGVQQMIMVVPMSLAQIRY